MQFFNTLLLVAAVAAPAVMAGGDECQSEPYSKMASLSSYKPAQEYCQKNYPSTEWSKRGESKQYPVCRPVKEKDAAKDLYEEFIKYPADQCKIACKCITKGKGGKDGGYSYSTTTSADYYTSTTSAKYTSTTDYTTSTTEYTTSTTTEYTTSTTTESTTTSTTASTTTTTSAASVPTDCLGQGTGYTYTASNGKKLTNTCDQSYGADGSNVIDTPALDNFKACQDLCSTTATCVAITYINDPDAGASYKTCYLLSNTLLGSYPYANFDSAAITV